MATLIGLAAAGQALKEAPERAARLIPVQWYSRAHGLVQVAGLDRIVCLLGSLGLSLALLGVAFASALPTLVRKKTRPFLETAGLGLAMFLGCGISGWFLGAACATLTASGLRGFCGFGFSFGLVLLVTNKQRMAETPSRMLVLHTVTLLTMYLGVWSGRVVDAAKPRLCLVHILLAAAACVMGLLVTTLAPSRRRISIVVFFVLLVPFSGLVFGLGSERHLGEEPLLRHTYSTLRFMASTLEILTGALGILGGVCVGLWEPGRAGRLAFWLSVPAALSLSALEDGPHTPLLGGALQRVGPAGVLGLTSGLVAASGVALGLVLVSAGEALWWFVAPVPGAAGGDAPSFDLRPAADGTGRNTRRCVLEDAVVTLALLGVVMMGSAVLGVAGFLMASLGSPGLGGTVLAGTVAVLTAPSLLVQAASPHFTGTR